MSLGRSIALLLFFGVCASCSQEDSPGKLSDFLRNVRDLEDTCNTCDLSLDLCKAKSFGLPTGSITHITLWKWKDEYQDDAKQAQVFEDLRELNDEYLLALTTGPNDIATIVGEGFGPNPRTYVSQSFDSGLFALPKNAESYSSWWSSSQGIFSNFATETIHVAWTNGDYDDCVPCEDKLDVCLETSPNNAIAHVFIWKWEDEVYPDKASQDIVLRDFREMYGREYALALTAGHNTIEELISDTSIEETSLGFEAGAWVLAKDADTFLKWAITPDVEFHAAHPIIAPYNNSKILNMEWITEANVAAKADDTSSGGIVKVFLSPRTIAVVAVVFSYFF